MSGSGYVTGASRLWSVSGLLIGHQHPDLASHWSGPAVSSPLFLCTWHDAMMVSSPSSYKKPHIISMHLSQDHLQTFSLSGLWMMCDVISWCRVLEACWVWSTRVMMMILCDEVRWCSRARVSWIMIRRDEASMLVSGCHDDEIMYHVMTVLCQGVKYDDIKGWSYIVYCVVSGC